MFSIKKKPVKQQQTLLGIFNKSPTQKKKKKKNENYFKLHTRHKCLLSKFDFLCICLTFFTYLHFAHTSQKHTALITSKDGIFFSGQ